MAEQKKAGLEKTLEDYAAVGGTPDPRLVEHRGKCLGQILTNRELAQNMRRELELLRALHEAAEGGDPVVQKCLGIAYALFELNMQYLERINRVPRRLQNWDYHKEFSQ